MNCEQAKPFLYDRALGEGSSTELDKHLSGCAACQSELADLELTHKLLRQALPEEEPPRRIAFVADKPVATPRYNPLRFWQWSFAGAAALALLFAVLAVRKPAATPSADTYTRAQVDQIVAQAVSTSEQRQQAQVAAVIQSAGERIAEQYHYLESNQTQVYRQEEANRAELHQVAAIVGGGVRQ